jgi:predicted MFS family arabinose efflux permease
VVATAPWLLRESRAEGERGSDFAGAVTVTAGLMLLVYAMTEAATKGWGNGRTIGFLVASAVLLASFIVIELRTPTPIMPFRIFRLKTLRAANLVGLLVGAALFSQFFLLTLYMQQVLHYSAIQTGVAFIAITLTIVVVSNIAQTLVTRLGARRVLTVGLLVAATSLALLARLPEDGHYFWNIFPALVLAGIGMSLSFISMTIAGLTGVERADAGVASGLINTSRQIGGAVGLAAVSTVATTYTNQYVDTHVGTTALSAAALTHGFDITFYALAALAIGGALIAALFIEPQRRLAPVETVDEEALATIEEAA